MLIIGVDIGGTFTDLFLVNPETHQTALAKVLTTPDDPALGVMDGLRRIVADAGVGLPSIQTIIHGTTLVANAIIERKGARTGLITTSGFRDILEMRREKRYDIYDLFLELPEPLVPRDLRVGVTERVRADGTVVTPLCPDSTGVAIEELRRAGAESIAVCLLQGFQNPAHEREIRRLQETRAPEMFCSLSSDVCREIREFERCSTTVANAYVQPLMKRYLSNLEKALRSEGFAGPVFLMLSNGGISDLESARQYPIRSVESGPAGGAIAASRLARAKSLDKVIAFDMGGTTAKVTLIEGGEPRTTNQFEVARVYRFKKGSGLPIKVPVIEMIEIGTGGGSLSWVDSLGLLKVGPQSAGADPGPACYGRGGERPTVTDADLLLGYLDPDYFLGGEIRLDVEGAERAIREKVARPLGLDLERAASGIHEVANESMANAARIHAVERGQSAQEYALVAFGGAGPVHAWGVARKLGIRTFLVPPSAGVTSALGFTMAPISFDFVRTHIAALSDLDLDLASTLFAEMEAEGGAILERAGATPGDITYHRSADMRYRGQGHEISMSLPPGVWCAQQREEIQHSFNRIYHEIYHRANPDLEVEVVNWRLRASGPSPTGGSLPVPARSDREPYKGTRPVFFGELGERVDCPIYDRYALTEDFSCQGPLIVEERESTIVVGPHGRASVDPDLNVRIDLGSSK